MEERLEEDDIKDKNESYLLPLLRVQSTPSIQAYKHYLTTQNSTETEFIKCILDIRSSLENITLIEPILNWIVFVYNRLNGRIRFEDAMDLETKVAIDKFFIDKTEK